VLFRSQGGSGLVANDSTALPDSTAVISTEDQEMPALAPVPEDNGADAESTADRGVSQSADQKLTQKQNNESKKAAVDGEFSVQIGSFRSADNAHALVAKVTELGYRPEVEVASLGGQTYHRVVVFGLFSRQEAEQCGEHIRSAEGITYLIRHR